MSPVKDSIANISVDAYIITCVLKPMQALWFFSYFNYNWLSPLKLCQRCSIAACIARFDLHMPSVYTLLALFNFGDSFASLCIAGNDDTASQSSNRATTGFSPPYAPAPPVKMVPAVQATVIESLKPTIMIPSPPKVMRSTNLSGQLTQPYYNGFRPSYPSNSKLLKYRPGSSRPSSARTRILLQSTLQKESDMEWDWGYDYHHPSLSRRKVSDWFNLKLEKLLSGTIPVFHSVIR